MSVLATTLLGLVAFAPAPAPTPHATFYDLALRDAIQFSVQSPTIATSAFAPAPAPTSASTRARGVLEGLIVGTGALDVWSSQRAFANGAREGNPLAPEALGAQVLMKAGMTAGVIWCARALDARGHRKHALWMRIGVIALWGYATAHNLRHAR